MEEPELLDELLPDEPELDEPELPVDGFAAGVLGEAGVLLLDEEEDEVEDEPESDDFEAPRESVR